MIVSTLRFYERILLGLEHEDKDVQQYAMCCMSYLVCYLRLRWITLPEHVQAMLKHLPEAPE